MRPPLNYCTQSYVHIDGMSKWKKQQQQRRPVIYFELLIEQKNRTKHTMCGANLTNWALNLKCKNCRRVCRRCFKRTPTPPPLHISQQVTTLQSVDGDNCLWYQLFNFFFSSLKVSLHHPPECRCACLSQSTCPLQAEKAMRDEYKYSAA